MGEASFLNRRRVERGGGEMRGRRRDRPQPPRVEEAIMKAPRQSPICIIKANTWLGGFSGLPPPAPLPWRRVEFFRVLVVAAARGRHGERGGRSPFATSQRKRRGGWGEGGDSLRRYRGFLREWGLNKTGRRGKKVGVGEWLSKNEGGSWRRKHKLKVETRLLLFPFPLPL